MKNKAETKSNKLRILPIFIFCAVLTLTLRVSSLWDKLEPRDEPVPTINVGANKAVAQAPAQAKDSRKKTDNVPINSNFDSNSLLSVDSDKKENAFTQNELDILQNLAERRESLDLREKDIERKTAQLHAAEAQIERKITQLKKYEEKIKKLLGDFDEKQSKKIDYLVKLYTTMKPKEAARIFNGLDMEILISLFDKMNSNKAAPILAEMDGEKAKALTSELAQKRSLAEIEGKN